MPSGRLPDVLKKNLIFASRVRTYGSPSTFTAPLDRWPMRLTLPTAGWIALGLALSIVPRAIAESPKADAKERHWAFQPVKAARYTGCVRTGLVAIPSIASSCPGWKRRGSSRWEWPIDGR